MSIYSQFLELKVALDEHRDEMKELEAKTRAVEGRYIDYLRAVKRRIGDPDVDDETAIERAEQACLFDETTAAINDLLVASEYDLLWTWHADSGVSIPHCLLDDRCFYLERCRMSEYKGFMQCNQAPSLYYCDVCFKNNAPQHPPPDIEKARRLAIKKLLEDEASQMDHLEGHFDQELRASKSYEWRRLQVPGLDQCSLCEQSAEYFLRGSREALCVQHFSEHPIE
jgi:hypothetical protein